MMRKLVLFCLALALAATSVPALAASQIDFSGYLKVFHENLHNFNRLPRDINADNDSFFENKLQINLEIQPNDDITVFWIMRSLNYQRWGNYTDLGNNAAGSGLYTRALYAEIRQPWGTVQIGRLIDGLGSSSGGLASLGYVPCWGYEFLCSEVFDTGNPADSIVYSYDFGNGFVLAAYYAKDALDGNVGTVNQLKDADRDRFGIEPRYQWDTGGVSLGVVYLRDMTYDDGAWATKDAYEIQINPAFVQNWGPFAIHFEGTVGFGKYTQREYNALNCINNTQCEREFKSNGLALYLDASYNYGAGDITLMSWYADGTSYDDVYDANGIRNIPKFHSAVGMGTFYPFLVAYNATTLGTGTWSNNVADGFGNPLGLADVGNTNHWGIGLLGNHAINDDIKLNYGLGYFRLVSLPFTNDVNGFGRPRPNTSKSLGFEIDLGATFQILDNLSFESQFGYMFNGSAHRISGYTGAGVAWYLPKPKNTFAWANVLAVTF